MRDLITTRNGTTYFAERVWGASLRYDLGEAHPLMGRSCPDIELGATILSYVRSAPRPQTFRRALELLEGYDDERSEADLRARSGQPPTSTRASETSKTEP